MFNYAFIVNSEGMGPKDYHWEYENDSMKFRFFATNGIEATKECAKKLAEDGFSDIDLCGDFDADKAKAVADATGGKIAVEYAKYFDEEVKKLENLKKQDEYGIIIMAEGLSEDDIKSEKVKSSEFNTTIVLVGSEKAAAAAARNLVNDGIDFIELCSYFDSAKATEIINAIGGKAPVGYCG